MQRSEALAILRDDTPTDDAATAAAPVDEALPPRPRTRGDCEPGKGIRPCPWASCRHHLHLDALESGSLKLRDMTTLSLNAWGADVEAFIDAAAESVTSYGESCVLDIADRGDATLEEVARHFQITRERIRQIEAKGMKNLLRGTPKAKRAELREALREVLRTKR